MNEIVQVYMMSYFFFPLSQMYQELFFRFKLLYDSFTLRHSASRPTSGH